MGIDIQGSRLLAFARKEGVDFSRTATLGRQSLHTPLPCLGKLLREVGIAVGAAEFGKIASTLPYSEGLIEVLGAREVVSIDASLYEQATIVHDMNRDIPAELEGGFSAVLDGGTLEHVFDFPTAIRNCMRMVKVGGHFLSVTITNNFMGHGFYQFSPELFYRVFAPENGFKVEHMFATEARYGASWFSVVDPAQVGKRVELINSVPTYLLVVARKTGAAELLRSPPQQSDYERIAWQDGGASDTMARPQRSTLQRNIRDYAPGWMLDLSASARERKRTDFPANHFRRTNWRSGH